MSDFDKRCGSAPGRRAGPFDRAVDNEVSRLRRKIERDPRNPKLIATVWAGGYRFAGEVEPGDPVIDSPHPVRRRHWSGTRHLRSVPWGGVSQ